MNNKSDEAIQRRSDKGACSRTVSRVSSSHARQAGAVPSVRRGMRAARRAAILVMALCSALLAQTPTTQPEALDLARAQQSMVRRAVGRVAPSVVTIETVGGITPQGGVGLDRPGAQSRPGRGRPGPGRRTPSAGTGFEVGEGPTTGLVFSSAGLILTSSFNFVRDPVVITVRLSDGRRYPARLLARDEIRRLAVLKIDATGLPAPSWAEETHVRVGQWAVALGRGFGGDDVGVSLGIVSGLNRMSGNAIQTDAGLSPANYGGPLIDLTGRVLGLIVPISYSPGDLAGVELYDSGIGFIVPAWQAEPAAAQLAKGTDLVRGVLGVRVDMTARSAVRIMAVADPSPAKTAGLMPGDELVAIDDRPISNWPDMQRRLAFRAAGEAIALTIRRSGTTIYADAALADIDAIGPFPVATPRDNRLPGERGEPKDMPFPP